MLNTKNASGKSLYHLHMEALRYLRQRLGVIEAFRAKLFDSPVLPEQPDMEEIATKIESLKLSIKTLENSQ